MQLKFPIPDVTLKLVDKIPLVDRPVYSGNQWQISQQEFAMHVDGVADFYVRDGEVIELAAVPGADPDWINLYLNGHVLAALFHQRKIINFHASSFIYQNRGIMVLGETGAGKSSVTASFTLKGAGFLSDDFTPILFNEEIPSILPVHQTIRLRRNAVNQLSIHRSRIKKAEEGTEKYFFHAQNAEMRPFPLHTILKIEIGNNQVPEFDIPDPAVRFSILRSEICSWEMLGGMPGTEEAYLHQLIAISEKVELIRVIRPKEIGIRGLHKAVEEFLDRKVIE